MHSVISSNVVSADSKSTAASRLGSTATTLTSWAFSSWPAHSSGSTECRLALRRTIEKTRSAGEQRFVAALYSASKVLQFDVRLALRLRASIRTFEQRQIQLLPGVKRALSVMKIPKILLTKGRISEQGQKLQSSGLAYLFSDVVIVPSKNLASFRKTLRTFRIQGKHVISIGNSVLHDILPATQNSAQAIWLNHPENIHGRNAKVPRSVPEVKAWRKIPAMVRSIQRKNYSHSDLDRLSKTPK
jgi:FMN phosphatase YigB (HAD superfamily)